MEGVAVEEEDLLYLDYYLSEKVNLIPSDDGFTSWWSPISNENAGDPESICSPVLVLGSSSEEKETLVKELQLRQSSPIGKELVAQIRSPRKNKGIPKSRFVSYHSFPPVQGKPFVCKVCGTKLATKESSRRHVLSKHSKERPFVCDQCGKSFIFKFALRSHIAIHSDVPMYVCVCGMSFKLRSSYMNHIQRIHRAASDLKYPCELCFKSFGDRHTLRLHMVSVHKPKTIPCIKEGCKKVFSSISLMHCHYRYHLNQKYTCDKCGQSFSTEAYMNKHRLSHSGVRPYACIECGNSYLSASHLNQHYHMRHTTNRKFQCSMCGKCFKTKAQLKYHESNHRGEKPYKCEMCGYATAYKNTYYAHRKKHRSETFDNSLSNIQNGSQSSSKTIESMDLEETNGSTGRRKHKRTYQPIKPSVTSQEVTNIPSGNATTEATQIICSRSISSLIIPSPSSAIASSSFTSLSKQGSVDLILIPSNVLTPEHQLNESFIDTSLDLEMSLKCSNSIIDNSDADGHSFTKGCAYKETLYEPEKEGSLIIISKNGRCAISDCEGGEDSILLVKLGENVGENSYAGVCEHHIVSGEMSELSLNSVENLTITTLDPKSLECNETSKDNNSVQCVNSLSKRVHSLSKLELEMNNADVLLNVPTKTDKIIVNDNVLNSSAVLFGDYNQSLLKKAEEEISFEEEENDTSIATLSGHIIDDSFRLAHLEVICPLCDEQFSCMDTYITHLECSHN